MVEHSLCRVFGITPDEIKARMAFLDLGGEDMSRAERLRAIIAEDIDGIIEEFYDHLLKFNELGKFFADRQSMHRLREAQRNYLLNLGKGIEDIPFYEDRLRIGQTHERIGLRQKWYIGAGTIFFGIIAQRVRQAMADDVTALVPHILTLHKLLTVDVSLAVETYHQAATQRLESILGQLTETQEHLQKISRLDGLTQVANRRFLMESLEMELYRCRRFGHSFCLVMLDIDHFKRINDSLGHAFGDRCIQSVVECVKGGIRQSDIIGRYGGEEFVVGMVETPIDAARQIVERIRLNVALTPVQSEGQRTSVTVSLGLAELAPDVKNLESLIVRADEALYQAKAGGRNQTRVHGQSELAA